MPDTSEHSSISAQQHGIIRCPDFDAGDFTVTLQPYGPYTIGDIKALIAQKILERGGPKYPVAALTLYDLLHLAPCMIRI
jgi:hypothetical protein